MQRRNRSTWLWLGVVFCTASGALFGSIIGAGGAGKLVAGVLIGIATGFAVGVYGARKSVGK